MTIGQVMAICEEVCDTLETELIVPVEVNPRFSRTLGRVRYEEKTDGSCYPTKVEFSKRMLENDDEEYVCQVIKHEMVHYYLLHEYKKSFGHDKNFKLICRKIGCTHDGSKAPERSKGNGEGKQKYDVYCPICGWLRGYSRKCKTTKDIEGGYCFCNKCHTGVKLVQNW